MDAWERQYDAILTHPVELQHVPIVEDEPMTSTTVEDKHARAQITALHERFAGLEGYLFGHEGTTGAFGELQTDIKTILRLQEETRDQVTKLCHQQSADVQSLKTEIALQKKDIDSVGMIARVARDGMETMKERSGGGVRRAWEKVWPMLLSILLVGGAAALWRGISEMLQP